MAGARAAQAWLESEGDDARIAIIWLPMVPGDDRAAAVEAAAAFPADRTAQFWDGSRLIGRTWSANFVVRHMEELRQAVSRIPDLAQCVDAWSSAPPPAWDCAFFYRAGSTWTEPLPPPDAWTKQLGFWRSSDGTQNGGTFWCDRSTTALVDSRWTAEMETGMRAIVGGFAHNSLTIEVLGFDGCPNTRTMRANIEVAMKALGFSTQVQYVDEEALPPNDPRRGWPAPTVLVEGRDLFGLRTPTDATLSCRVYPGGAPGVEEIVAALRAVVASGKD